MRAGLRNSTQPLHEEALEALHHRRVNIEMHKMEDVQPKPGLRTTTHS
jgi:hypothetical protein